MAWAREALVANQSVVQFLYGQVFFVLGLSILFLARRTPRLELARRLPLLAAFGFCEALVAWGSAFAPALAGGSRPGAILRLLLLALGYSCLFAFGLQMHIEEKGPTQRKLLPFLLFALWAVDLGAAALWSRLGPLELAAIGEAACRCGMALPGGLLSAWGLRRQTYRTIEPEVLSRIKPYLRVVGVSLGGFGLLGGLVVPVAPFFPANLFNQEGVVAVLGVPPAIYRGFCGILLVYGIVRTLGAVHGEMQQWIEEMERRQALAADRERIGRDLHDGIIQSIYAAGLMLEGVRQNIPQEPHAAQEQLTRVMGSLNQTIQHIRRYIFDLRGDLPEDDLQTGLANILQDFRVNTLLDVNLEVHGDGARPLDVERRRHIFQIAREALTNVARHAQARRVGMELTYWPDVVMMRIADDGVGLATVPDNGGHGLRNIRERTRLLDGTLDIESAPGRGFTLTVTVPY